MDGHDCLQRLLSPPLLSCARQVVFFGRHKMRESLGWMGAFWASIGASIAAFWQVTTPACSLPEAQEAFLAELCAPCLLKPKAC